MTLLKTLGILSCKTTAEINVDALTALERKVDSYQKVMKHLKSAIKIFESEIDDFENSSRHNNLIVYGLNEEEDQTSEMLEKTINQKAINGIL